MDYKLSTDYSLEPKQISTESCGNKVRYWIGTDYPKIGTKEYPYWYSSLNEVVQIVFKIRLEGYQARIVMEQVITQRLVLSV